MYLMNLEGRYIPPWTDRENRIHEETTFNNNNLTGRWTQAPSNYSQPYSLTDSWDSHIKQNNDLFEKGTPYSGLNTFTFDNRFISQKPEWERLHDSLKSNKTTKLFGYDFETLNANLGNVQDIGGTSITEFGITESIVKGGMIKDKSYSAVFGVNKDNAISYAKEIALINEDGFKTAGYSDTSRLMSLIERLSRYSGNIKDRVELGNISKIGDVMLVKSLAESQGHNVDIAIEGLVNLSVLGGMNKEDFTLVAKELANGFYTGSESINFQKTLMNKYAITKQDFKASGFIYQGFDSNNKSTVFSGMVSKLRNAQTNGHFVLGYNTNTFDDKLMNAFTNGNGLNINKQIDVLDVIKYASNNNESVLSALVAEGHSLSTNGMRMSSQEGFARNMGKTFKDVAHNAGSDSMITNHIAAALDFMDTGEVDAAGNKVFDSLFGYALKNGNEATSNPLNLLDAGNLLYAENSIGIDRNGSDLMKIDGTDTSKWIKTGVNRGRYYNIVGAKQYQDNRFAVTFQNASSAYGSPVESFTKVYDNEQSMIDGITNNFSVANNVGKEVVLSQDKLSDADKARRNFDNLFDKNNIKFDRYDEKNNKHIYNGGYERLNQYYKAYEETVSILGGSDKIDDEIISKIADGEYEEEINRGLQKYSSGQDYTVSSSVKRDFRNMFGKLHDERELYQKLNESFEGSNLNNIQKTHVANQVRKELINGELSNGKEIAVVANSAKTSVQDLFSIELSGSTEESFNINFQNKDNAIKTLTNSAYRKTNNKKQAAEFLNNIALDLTENKGFLSPEDYSNILKLSDGAMLSELQPRQIAASIVNILYTGYIDPIKNHMTSYGVDSAAKAINNNEAFKIFEGDANLTQDTIDKYTNFINTKSNTSIMDSINAIKGTKFTDGSVIETLNDVVGRTNINSMIQSSMKDVSEVAFDFQSKAGIELFNQSLSDLNYDQSTIDYWNRMLFTSGKSKGLLHADEVDKAWKSNYITSFFHNEGESSFLITNRRDDNNIGKVFDIMTDSSLETKDKIKKIKENKMAFVMELPKINEDKERLKNIGYVVDSNSETGFRRSTDEDILNGTEIGRPTVNFDKDGIETKSVTPYRFATISQGDNGYEKIVHGTINSYNTKKTLSEFEMNLTDDAQEISKAFVKTREKIYEFLDSDELSNAEAYAKANRTYSKSANTVMLEMSSPVGMQSFKDKIGKDGKHFIPTNLDVAKSSYQDLFPLRELFLKTVKENINNSPEDLEIAEQLVKFRTRGNRKSYTLEDKLDDMIEQVTADHGKGTVSPQFDEFFMRSLFHKGLGDEEGIYQLPNGIAKENNKTIIDYLMGHLNQFSNSTKSSVATLAANKEIFSQYINKSAIQKGQLSFFPIIEVNNGANSDAAMRPVNVQSTNPLSYSKKEVQEQMEDMYGTSLGSQNITLGYERTTRMRNQIEENLKNIEIGKTGYTGGELEQVITARFKQVSSTDMLNKMNKLGAALKNKDEELAKEIAEYGMDINQDGDLLEKALGLVKSSYNTTESKGSLRFAFTHNDYFNSPDIRPIEIDELDSDYQKYAIQMLKEDSQLKPGNFSEQVRVYALEQGAILNKLDEPVLYSGPEGSVSDPEKFIKQSKGSLILNKKGIGDVKGVMSETEKATYKVINYDSIEKQVREAFDNDPKKVARYTNFIYDKTFGKGVSGITDSPIVKHMNAGTLANFLNVATNEAIKLSDMPKMTNQLNELVETARKNIGFEKGFKFSFKNGHFVTNLEEIGEQGVVGIGQEMSRIVANATNKNSYQLYQNIHKTWEEFSESDVYIGTLARTGLQTSTSGEVTLDARMSINFESQGKEEISEYITDELNEGWNAVQVGDKKLSLNQYLLKTFRDESLSGDYANNRHNSYLKTLKGIDMAFNNFDNPNAISKTNPYVLDLALDDIILMKAGASESDLNEYGLFKFQDGKGGDGYSELVKNAATRQGKDINDIRALRISLEKDGTKGISFKLNGETITEALIPYYDITPFKKQVYNTEYTRAVTNVIDIAKNFGGKRNGKKVGLKQSKKDLQKATEILFKTYANNMIGKKGSYFYENLTNIKLKNSGRALSQHIVSPNVEAMADDMWKEQSLDGMNYREKVLNAVRNGDTSVDYNGKTYGLTHSSGAKTSIEINGKLYNEDVQFMSRARYENVNGISFTQTGKNILNNWEGYMPKIEAYSEIYKTKMSKSNLINSLKESIEYSELDDIHKVAFDLVTGENFNKDIEIKNIQQVAREQATGIKEAWKNDKAKPKKDLSSMFDRRQNLIDQLGSSNEKINIQGLIEKRNKAKAFYDSLAGLNTKKLEFDGQRRRIRSPLQAKKARAEFRNMFMAATDDLDDAQYLLDVAMDTINTKSGIKGLNQQIRSTKEILDNMYKSRTDAIKGIFESSNESLKAINDILKRLEDTDAYGKIAEKYIGEIGVFGYAGRHPFISPLSGRVIKFSLDNTLLQDEIGSSASYAFKVNDDNDGDFLIQKNMIENNALKSYDSLDVRAASKRYETQLLTGQNNSIMADLIEDEVKKINKTGKSIDSMTDWEAYKSTVLEKGITEKEFQRIKTKLQANGMNLENVNSFKDIEDSPELISEFFKEHDRINGNILANKDMIAAASKANITQNEVGYVSNVNYLVNQSINIAMDDALNKKDVNTIKELQRIKTSIMSDDALNAGVLADVEQGVIDVKHAGAGSKTSQTPKWRDAMGGIFKSQNDRDLSQPLNDMYDVISPTLLPKQYGKLKLDTPSKEEFFDHIMNRTKYSNAQLAPLENGIRALIDLSKNSIVRNEYNENIAGTINTVQDAIEYRALLKKIAKHKKQVESNTTALSDLLNRQLTEASGVESIAYTNVDDMITILKQDDIHIASGIGSSGNNTGYLIKKITDMRDGTFHIGYDSFDIKDPSVRADGVFKGTVSQINDEIQSLFGNFKKYSIKALDNLKEFQNSITSTSIDKNINDFASMVVRNLDDTIENTRNSFIGNLNPESLEYEQSVKLVDNYVKNVDVQHFIDFRDKIRYIKDSKGFKPGVNANTVLEDSLASINKEIIQSGLNKKTSTSIEGIFDKYIRNVASETAMSNFDTAKFKSFTKEPKPNRLDGIFDEFDTKRIDLNAAKEQFDEILKGAGNSSDSLNIEVDKILNKYNAVNEQFGVNARMIINSASETINDLDAVFNWSTNNLADMRVGVGKHFGKMFKELDYQEIKETLDHQLLDKDTFTKYEDETTKRNLRKFLKEKNNNIVPEKALNGAEQIDLSFISTKAMNERILEEPITEGMLKGSKETIKNTAEKMTKRKIGETVKDGFNNMTNSTGGKIIMGLAALGIASNLLDSKTQSPLTPEMKPAGGEGSLIAGRNSGDKKPAPGSGGRKTVYASNNNSGLQFKISGKSKHKIQEMQTAQRISGQIGGNANINVYDDRSQVSNNWLERKFSEIV